MHHNCDTHIQIFSNVAKRKMMFRVWKTCDLVATVSGRIYYFYSYNYRRRVLRKVSSFCPNCFFYTLIGYLLFSITILREHKQCRLFRVFKFCLLKMNLICWYHIQAFIFLTTQYGENEGDYKPLGSKERRKRDLWFLRRRNAHVVFTKTHSCSLKEEKKDM